MHPIIEQHREELEAACRKYAVTKLELFGSAARDDFDEERSDLDFLVEFDDPLQGNAFHQFFGFQFKLEDIYGKKVDLLSPSEITNPYLLKAVNRSRRLLYGT